MWKNGFSSDSFLRNAGVFVRRSGTISIKKVKAVRIYISNEQPSIILINYSVDLAGCESPNTFLSIVGTILPIAMAGRIFFIKLLQYYGKLRNVNINCIIPSSTSLIGLIYFRNCSQHFLAGTIYTDNFCNMTLMTSNKKFLRYIKKIITKPKKYIQRTY